MRSHAPGARNRKRRCLRTLQWHGVADGTFALSFSGASEYLGSPRDRGLAFLTMFVPNTIETILWMLAATHALATHAAIEEMINRSGSMCLTASRISAATFGTLYLQ
jgi:hypothetical protein